MKMHHSTQQRLNARPCSIVFACCFSFVLLRREEIQRRTLVKKKPANAWVHTLYSRQHGFAAMPDLLVITDLGRSRPERRQIPDSSFKRSFDVINASVPVVPI